MKRIQIKATLVWQIPYITDGLVAYWDGEWNSGGGIHNPSATDWKDLAGYHDLVLRRSALSNFTWRETGLRHIGPNVDIETPLAMSDLIAPSNTFTLSYLVSFERINDMPRYVPFGFGNGDIGFGYRDTVFFATLPWADGFTSKPFDTLIGKTMMFTISTNGTRLFAAHDGIRFGDTPCGDYRRILAAPLAFFCSPGYNPSVEDSWICTIHRILVYNRPLTESEDVFNHEVDVVRHGG